VNTFIFAYIRGILELTSVTEPAQPEHPLVTDVLGPRKPTNQAWALLGLGRFLQSILYALQRASPPESAGSGNELAKVWI